MRLTGVLLLVPLLVAARPAPAQSPGNSLPYRDPRLPVDARVRDLVARMTPEEKFWQLFMVPGDLDAPSHDYSHGVFGLQIPPPTAASGGGPGASARADAERINTIQRHFVERTRLGIPIVPFDEAVHGLTRPGATVFPQAIALAATWDPALVARVAGAIAAETRSRGIRQVLSPVANLADDVRWGRVEETYGEDPYLASVMTRAFVSAFAAAGIVATPKHFVANVGEGGRDSYPIDLDERALEEREFPPFRAALDAGARSIMTAYNSVDGSPATQSRRLLTDTLRTAWGFTGYVISDAAATGGATVLHMTEPDVPTAARDAWEAGLDVVFQSSYEQFRPYWEAIRRHLVPDAVVDAAVARVLRAKFELGLFEHPYADADEAARANGTDANLALAREAARASIVLLKNDRGLLPLGRGLRRIAVIGADAAEARLGDYSGPGVRPVTILDGIRRRFGPGAVAYAPGPGRSVRSLVTIPAEAFESVADGRRTPGLQAEYFDNPRLDGPPRVVRTDPQVDVTWTFAPPAPDVPRDWYSVRWTGTLQAPAEGAARIGVEGNDGYRLYLDGTLVIDDWAKRSYGLRVADVTLAPGSTHELRLEYFEAAGRTRLRLVWNAGVRDDSGTATDEAVSLASSSDVAIVVAGLEEGEFRDRARLGLPGRQEDLIRAVAATGTPTVVVLIGGSAVTMSGWLDRVGAVLDAWYPGEQGGDAVADVLAGDADPGGRLPIDFPIAEGQLPLRYDHKPTGRGDDYLDLTGLPLFPFGFGLSYASFAYSDLHIEPGAIDPTGTATVRCAVTNTGTRAGDEVAQLYLRDELASVVRPVLALAGFQRVHLAPGERREVTFSLGPAELGLLDRDLHHVVEPGAFRILVGASSLDLRLRGELTVR